MQDFFDTVVEPVMVGELGYRLTVIDGRQAYDRARIDDEIFAKLHRASIVVADITGSRPNCFLELGYALGRALPTIVTARAGSELRSTSRLSLACTGRRAARPRIADARSASTGRQ